MAVGPNDTGRRRRVIMEAVVSRGYSPDVPSESVSESSALDFPASDIRHEPREQRKRKITCDDVVVSYVSAVVTEVIAKRRASLVPVI